MCDAKKIELLSRIFLEFAKSISCENKDKKVHRLLPKLYKHKKGDHSSHQVGVYPLSMGHFKYRKMEVKLG